MSAQIRGVYSAVAAATGGRTVKFHDFLLYGLLAALRLSCCFTRPAPRSRWERRNSPPPGWST
jgi:hypothetical protein